MKAEEKEAAYSEHGIFWCCQHLCSSLFLGWHVAMVGVAKCSGSDCSKG